MADEIWSHRCCQHQVDGPKHRVSFAWVLSSLERYLTGLLTEQPHKNCDTMAQVVPGTTQQNLQSLLTDLVWDEQALNRQRLEQRLALPREGDGALVIDDTGFVKKGKASVGVARQYTGTAGQLCHCQVTVNCHYAERTLAWPVATRLYLPRAWTAAPARCAKAPVPEELEFQTKAEIALDLVEAAAAQPPIVCSSRRRSISSNISPQVGSSLKMP